MAKAPARAARQTFDLHPGVASMQEWITTLPEKTGRSLDQWMKHIRAQKLPDEKAARGWLKADLKIGGNTAWFLAERAFAKDLSLMDDDPDRYMSLAPKYVEDQYAGKKAALRPIFDRLFTLARSLGKDAKLCPCRTIIPVYREHVVAQIKPTTNSRVDLGLCLTPLVKAKKKLPARLIDTGGFQKKDRITHRIPIERVEQIDDFVEKWLRTAWDLDVK